LPDFFRKIKKKKPRTKTFAFSVGLVVPLRWIPSESVTTACVPDHLVAFWEK